MGNKRYRRAFASNPTSRYDDTPARELADELVYVSPYPMFDSVASDPVMRSVFEDNITNLLEDYDADLDVILDFGDPLIKDMMIYFLSDLDAITVGRYNKKMNKYVVTTLRPWWTDEMTEVKDDE